MKTGTIYVVREPRSGFFKLGFSVDWRARVADLGRRLGVQLEVVLLIPVISIDIERMMHRCLRKWRIQQLTVCTSGLAPASVREWYAKCSLPRILELAYDLHWGFAVTREEITATLKECIVVVRKHSERTRRVAAQVSLLKELNRSRRLAQRVTR